MTELRRALGFRDLVLFYVVTTWSLRWVATAAAIGPSALVFWVLAAALLFVPLVFTVLELSSRYPDEGGLYVWTKRAFGPFAGFLSGWMYWVTNLPYFPGLLYFAAANILFAGGPSAQSLSTSPPYFIAVSVVGLSIAVTLNVVGLNIGKWLNNAGAVGGWIPFFFLVGFGLYSWTRYGSATAITPATLAPGTGLKDLVFLSTIAFAFGGVESGSTMAEEIVDAKRTVPRAVVVAAVIIATFYIVGTWCLLLALPKDQLSGLQGVMQAMQAMALKARLPWIVPIAAILITLNALGGIGAWFAATARLPFVAGLDHYLPAAFGRLHSRWKTPYVALLVQAAFAFAFVFIGQAGTSVRGAYDALVSMSVVSYFIPFLFMFAAMAKLQREPAPADVLLVPGGPPVARLLAAVGFVVTVAAIVLACVPANDDPNKTLAVIKVVGGSLALVVAGAAVYFLGKRQS
ncbi:MAG TPA: APC family permease [Vicinamibacterales bacterium]|nr:APC family permease [Vicinamibacterales bacterium]